MKSVQMNSTKKKNLILFAFVFSNQNTNVVKAFASVPHSKSTIERLMYLNQITNRHCSCQKKKDYRQRFLHDEYNLSLRTISVTGIGSMGLLRNTIKVCNKFSI